MQNPTISELSAAWIAEDNMRTSRFSETDLAAASELILGTGNGDKSKRAERLRSFMTGTSASAELFGDVAQRSVQALYQHAAPGLKQICRIRENLPNWNEVKSHRIDGLEAILPIHEEGADYTQRTITEDDTGYRLHSHGAHYFASEELLRGDIINGLATIPERMVKSALRTEQAFICSLLVDADGPIDSVFTQQGSVSNLPLTITNLETAVGAMLSYSDADGLPVVADPKYLIVPPQLKIKAMQILNSIQIAPPSDGTIDRGTKNVLADFGIELIIEPFIPKFATSGTKGATSWFLAADPANIPLVEFGTLAGSSVPQITTMGAGSELHFNRDIFAWKVRHIFGGTIIDRRGGWASVGQ